MTYAVIIADPNSSERGEIVSTHNTALAAGRALRKHISDGAYVAKRRSDGSYPHRVEALELPAHNEAVESAVRAEHYAGRSA